MCGRLRSERIGVLAGGGQSHAHYTNLGSLKRKGVMGEVDSEILYTYVEGSRRKSGLYGIL